MTKADRLRGLYAVTDPGLVPREALGEAVAAAIRGGARIVQYRDKTATEGERLGTARRLAEVCRRAGVLFIVNDDPGLAAEVGADGVHLGREDAAMEEARALLGAEAVIGVSCYTDLERARRAAAAGADYVAFGRFFPSRTKPDAAQATPDLLEQARRELDLPVVAIGGITPENGAALISAGADMLAVVHALFGQPNIEAAARRFTRLFG
ncbi:MAG TPA: thiamine phosphate synthase [Thiotrichales bacterium]|nr:thiamine phosphate synthase [Thiotrichales bacterium]